MWTATCVISLLLALKSKVARQYKTAKTLDRQLLIESQTLAMLGVSVFTEINGGLTFYYIP
jgi:hypothetical protein